MWCWRRSRGIFPRGRCQCLKLGEVGVFLGVIFLLGQNTGIEKLFDRFHRLDNFSTTHFLLHNGLEGAWCPQHRPFLKNEEAATSLWSCKALCFPCCMGRRKGSKLLSGKQRLQFAGVASHLREWQGWS